MQPAADPLTQAYEIAKAKGLHIHPVRERKPRTFPPEYYIAYVVYRKAQYRGGSGVRLGRRKNADDLLRFVKRLTSENTNTTEGAI